MFFFCKRKYTQSTNTVYFSSNLKSIHSTPRHCCLPSATNRCTSLTVCVWHLESSPCMSQRTIKRKSRQIFVFILAIYSQTKIKIKKKLRAINEFLAFLSSKLLWKSKEPNQNNKIAEKKLKKKKFAWILTPDGVKDFCVFVINNEFHSYSYKSFFFV